MSGHEIAKEPGWYTHPSDPIRTERWWDGVLWTDLTRDVEPEVINVAGNIRTVLTFVAKHRPLNAADVRDNQRLPTGPPRTDGVDMEMPEDAVKKNKKKSRPRRVLGAGPINPRLLPSEPATYTPRDTYNRLNKPNKFAVTGEVRNRHAAQTSQLKLLLYAAVTMSLVLFVVGFRNAMHETRGVENAYDPFNATVTANDRTARVPPPTSPPANPPLGLIVPRTESSLASAQTLVEPVVNLNPDPGQSVYRSSDGTFSMLYNSQWQLANSDATSGRILTSDTNEAIPDSISIMTTKRDLLDDINIIESHLRAIVERGGSIISKTQSPQGAANSAVFVVSANSEYYVEGVLIGKATISTIRWTTFDQSRFQSQQSEIISYIGTAVTS